MASSIARRCASLKTAACILFRWRAHWYALSNRETKLEIDGFNQAVTERFGERTLLSNAAREPSGRLYEKLSEGMKPEQKEQLKQAWPVMRTAQQLAAHERTEQSLRQAEEQRLTQRQTPVMKQ